MMDIYPPLNKKHRGGSIRATILPHAIILTKAHRAAVSILAKGSIVAWVYIASEVFLISTTQIYQYFNVFLLFALFSDKPEVFLPKYSQTAILHAAHFRRVVMGDCSSKGAEAPPQNPHRTREMNM